MTDRPLSGKLFDLFGSMDASERRQCKDYVASPFHNKNQRLIALYDVLENPAEKAVTKEDLFFAAFPEKKQFSDGSYRAIVSELTQLIESFFAQLDYQENPHYKEMFLLSMLSRKRLHKQVEQQAKKNAQFLEEETEPSESYFFCRLMRESLLHQHSIVVKNRGALNNLQAVLHEVDQFFANIKLCYVSVALNRQAVVDVPPFDLGMVNDLFEAGQKDLLMKDTSTWLWYLSTQVYFQKGKSLEFAIQLFDELNRLESKTPPHIQRALYIFVGNYFIRKIVEEPTEINMQYFFKAYRKIFSLRIAHGFDGYISPNLFLNYGIAGVMVNEIEMVEQEIDRYKEEIHPDIRELVMELIYAHVYYETKDRSALEASMKKLYLLSNQFPDHYYKLQYSVLKTRIEFDRKEWGNLLNTLEATRQYVRRNTLMPARAKTSYMNALKAIKILMKYKQKQISKGKASDQINKLFPLFHGLWILRKLEE